MGVGGLGVGMGKESVEPLEQRAYFSVTVMDDGYVKIEQDIGNPPIYTPDEVREIAEELGAAADEGESKLSE